jgi:glycosyltransferase involved in cell wall biosynthesis
MPPIKVLLIQNYIAHYNLPIYNLLGSKSDIDLTIAHFGKPVAEASAAYKEVLLTTWKKGPFILINDNIYSLCNSFDVVIAMGDIHFLDLMMLGKKRKRKYRLIYWGIGVSASYDNKFDADRKWDFIRYFFMRGADALLFYSSYPVDKYSNHGFMREKLFVANNTVKVTRSSNIEKTSESILFVGTLYKEKGIYELLDAYLKASSVDENLPILNIVGNGEEYSNIEKWIITYNLSQKIKLLGAIYDDATLEQLFMNAIVSVSPNQAGLSVLKSMGYGVPFITRFDSITGGERFNITNDVTGTIYNNPEELVDILCKMNEQKEKYKRMGAKALDFYDNFRLPEHMVQGFLDAIFYVLTKNRASE